MVGDRLYLWAGYQTGLPTVHDSAEERKVTSNVQIFSLPSGKWATQATTGTSPLGVKGYACNAVTDKLYYFGGDCNHDGCYHNSVNELDTASLTWRELEPTDKHRPVMRRAYGGTITIERDGVYYLLIIGGHGSTPTTQLPQANYIEVVTGRWRTNERSMYCLSTGKTITT